MWLGGGSNQKAMKLPSRNAFESEAHNSSDNAGMEHVGFRRTLRGGGGKGSGRTHSPPEKLQNVLPSALRSYISFIGVVPRYPHTNGDG